MAHNGFRRRHGAQSLVWSENLAADAKSWCNVLALKDKPVHDVQSLEAKKQGENLASIKVRQKRQEQHNVPRLQDCFPIVRSWYSENVNYDYMAGSPKTLGSEIRDFAQVL